MIEKTKHQNLFTVINRTDIIDYEARVECGNYFIALYDCLPNWIIYRNIDVPKLLKSLTETFAISEENITTYKVSSKNERKDALQAFLITIKEKEIMIFGDTHDQEVKLLYKSIIDKKYTENIIKTIKRCTKRQKAESKIFLLQEDGHGLYLRDFKVKKIKVDVETLYNDNFLPIHQLVVNRLNTKDDKGLVLFYGVPGTGKTSYIRYLTSLINKKMVYISPELAQKIATPSFLKLLLDNPNSVLIIEDAENVIESRELGENQAVSNLLNIADGLLADCLNIQIVCTFNTHISKVDKALLRKGRLIASYEFDSLTAEKAQILSNKLGFKKEFKEPATLAEIYNQETTNFDTETNKSAIGFGK
jgi:SpoVK/Ycf46/Vps4 family AAA+-type ATPase